MMYRAVPTTGFERMATVDHSVASVGRTSAVGLRWSVAVLLIAGE